MEVLGTQTPENGLSVVDGQDMDALSSSHSPMPESRTTAQSDTFTPPVSDHTSQHDGIKPAQNDVFSRLRSAGFSYDEIKEYLKPKLVEAGFADQEIAAYFRQYAIGEGKDRASAKASLWQYLSHGVEGSVSGLWYREKMPDSVTEQQMADADWIDRLAMSVGQMVGDLPTIVAGGVMGAFGGFAAPVTVPAAAFGLTEGMRATYMDRIESGHTEDFFYLEGLGKVLHATGKGAAIGAVTGGAGKLTGMGAQAAGLGKIGTGISVGAAESVAMPTTGAALEGRLPHPQEFLDAAVFIGTMHGVQHGVRSVPQIVPKLRDIYTKTGKTPNEIAEVAAQDPRIREDLLAINRDGTEVFATDVLERLKVGKEVPYEEIHAYRDAPWAQAALNERAAPETVREKLGSLFDKAVKNEDVRERVAWGFVKADEAARITELSNVKVSAGFTHTVNVREIQHAYHRHGGESEYLRGQIPITAEDISKIPEIVRGENTNISGGKTNRGKDAIVYESQQPDGNTIYIEEVHTGKQQLAFKSMWKIQRPPESGGLGTPDAYVPNEPGYAPRGIDAIPSKNINSTYPEVNASEGRASVGNAGRSLTEERPAANQDRTRRKVLSDFSEGNSVARDAAAVIREKPQESPLAEAERARSVSGDPDILQRSGSETSIAIDPNKPVMPESPLSHKNTTSLSAVVDAIADALSVPIRTGKMGPSGRGAVGIYSVKAEVIHTKTANDIATIMHEAGHHIQKQLFGSVDAEPLRPFAHELSSIATKPRAGQSNLPEGFAEFVAKYVVNPKDAKEKAPQFYEHFEKTLLDKEPAFGQALLDARTVVKKWADQPAAQEVLSHISIEGREKEGFLSRMLFKDTWQRLYTNTIDRLYPLKKAVDYLRDGKELPEDLNPYILARVFSGAKGQATHFIERSPFKFDTYENVGKSLKDTLQRVENMDEFRAYLVSRRGLELESRGVNSGIRKEAMEGTLRELEQKYEPLARELDEYQSHLTQYLIDSGVLGKEAATTMREMNRRYIPFYRVMESDTGFLGGGKNLNAKNPIKKIKGSGRDIVDPIESIIKNTYAIIEAADKNAIGRALTDLAAGKEGSGWMIEKLPTPKQAINISGEEVTQRFINSLGVDKQTRNTLREMAERGDMPEIVTFWQNAAMMDKTRQIAVFRDGKREVYQVDPEIAEVMNGLNAQTMPWFIKLAALPSKFLRAGATLTPDFMVRNLIRDATQSGVLSRSGFIPLVDTVRGFKRAVKRDQTYWDWVKSGGDQATLVSADRTTLQKTLQDITATGYKDKVWNVVRNPLEALRVCSEISEQGTRLGEFGKAVKKYGSDKRGMIRAAYESRDLMDFARSGNKMKNWNVTTAFFNASLQGLDRAIRGAIENPKRVAALMALYIGIPSLINAIRNYGDEDVAEVNRAQRDMFWIVPVGEGKNKTLLRIPKPFEMGVLGGSSVERITEFFMDVATNKYGNVDKARQENFRRYFDSIVDITVPNMLPTVLVPIIEGFANRSTTFNRAIVPANKEKLLPEYQYTPYTTELMKKLSHYVGSLPVVGEMGTFSPAIAEHYIRAWTGGMGMYFLQGLDAVGRKSGALPDPMRPAATLADIPFVRAFIARHPSMGAESIQRFYDSYNKTHSYVATVNALKKDCKYEDVGNLMPFSMYHAMEGPKKALNNLLKAVDTVYKAEAMTPHEKRQIIDKLYMQAINIAKLGNKTFEMLQPQVEALKERAERSKHRR